MSHATIAKVEPIIGLEVHVELATRSKMFSRAPSPAHPEFDAAPPNSLIDPTVLALPGALPVMNKAAVEMAMMVGLALNCEIAPTTKWDRKGYFYPDMPKAYQISQYDLPLCFDGAVDLPGVDQSGLPLASGPSKRIGIIRAHLEEDAGKLLHEAPGGHAIDHSIVDLNRAGTPLLEIVTQPDFTSADEVVLFARLLRDICRFLGVTEGVMQKGHMRFEPNVNCQLTLSTGEVVRTPIVEVKNLNSFRSLRGAIEFELKEQGERYLADRRVMGKGAKVTRGWDDSRERTHVQREKEDAHDYRYFPDPDLVPVVVDEAWKVRVKGRVPELPLARFRRYVSDCALGPKEAYALTEERETCLLYENLALALASLGLDHARSGKVAANLLLQPAAKRANERGTPIHSLGFSVHHAAALAKLREDGEINNQALDELFDALPPSSAGDAKAALDEVRSLAAQKGMIVVRDESAMNGWIDTVLAANPKVAEDVRGGKVQAVGRLVGEAMKLAAGKADAKTMREMILKRLGQ